MPLRWLGRTVFSMGVVGWPWLRPRRRSIVQNHDRLTQIRSMFVDDKDGVYALFLAMADVDLEATFGGRRDLRCAVYSVCHA